MKKALLFLFLGICLLQFVSADTQSLQIRFIVPDQVAPTFDNLRNFTHTINTSFSKDFDASDNVEVSCFGLNDTSTFDIDCSGTITNVTALDTATIYWLNVSVNDTSGNEAYGEFYINVTSSEGTVSTIKVCRYKRFGYYDTSLSWFKEENCI